LEGVLNHEDPIPRTSTKGKIMTNNALIAGTVFEQLVGAVEKVLADEGQFEFPKKQLAMRLEIFLENHTDLVRITPAALRCEKRSRFWLLGTFREGSQLFHLAYKKHRQDDGYCKRLAVTRIPPAIETDTITIDLAA
jgi:hypothetical protein